MKRVSIIIRTRNEERWIESCLRAVYDQEYKNIEVIIVDNMSEDYTLKKIEGYPVKIFTIKDFKPGAALNLGIRESSGEIIVCLSGHCIPTNNRWLSRLVGNLDDKEVGGVYGRQEPLSYTSDIDKRDLLTVFRNEKVVQRKDSFFHNANSAFRREIWDEYPFDEEVTNIEDRLWGLQIINAGMSIVYEPEASVYHWHGINHGSHPERAQKIARILESIWKIPNSGDKSNIGESKIMAIVPVRSNEIEGAGIKLLEITIETLKKSKNLRKIIVSSDDPMIEEKTAGYFVESSIVRPKELSESYISIEQVLQYTLGKIEDEYGVQDIIVYADTTYPLREPELVDNMLNVMVNGGYDSVIAVVREERAIITKKHNKYQVIDDGFMPTMMKDSEHYVGLTGLVTITRPSLVRNGKLLGDNIGVYPIENKMQAIKFHPATVVTEYTEILRRVFFNKGE